jgi:flagellar L-ring protein precursor FlgH
MILNRRFQSVLILAALVVTTVDGAEKKKKVVEPSALDKYIQEALKNEAPMTIQASPGSLWTSTSRFTDIGADLRAVQVNDLVTIVVSEQASAVATGDVKTSRVSSVKSSVSSLAGPKSVTGALNNLAAANGDTELAGTGTTSRGSSLSTTLSARVTHVLPNGYLVLEGSKDVQVNSEHQEVTVRGIIRPIDLSPGNIVSSNQLAQLEIRINGKGVINDAVHRPWLLFRIILGLLPF